MKANFLLYLLLMLTDNTSPGKKNKYTYQVQGNVSNLKGYVYLMRYTGERIDSCKVVNQKFFMSGTINEPYLYAVVTKNHKFLGTFVLINNQIVITGDARKAATLKVSGDREHDMDMQWQNSIAGFIHSGETIDSLESRLPKTAKYKITLKKLHLKRGSIKQNQTTFEVGLIIKNPGKFLSLFYFWSDYEQFTAKQRQVLYNSLTAELKQNSLGKAIYAHLQVDKADMEIKPGVMVPDFSLADTSDHLITLSHFKGKYVLLVFWASWCAPCRAEHPALMKLINRMKAKNLVVLAVSQDRHKAEWISAIKQDKLTCVNVCDFAGGESTILMKYHIDRIPEHMLIGPDGRLLAIGDVASKLISRYFNKM